MSASISTGRPNLRRMAIMKIGQSNLSVFSKRIAESHRTELDSAHDLSLVRPEDPRVEKYVA